MATNGHGATVCQRLLDHLNQVLEDPNTILDVKLFEETKLFSTRNLRKDERKPLIQKLTGVLAVLQQDPSPVLGLLVPLLDVFTFTELLELSHQELPLTDGLAVGEHMGGYNDLVLTVLEKATGNPADAARVATMLDVMNALVRLWLCTTLVRTAVRAQKLLLDLLRVDQEVQTHTGAHVPSGGQGLVWKRIFGDRNIYATLFDACSFKGPLTISMSKQQKTLAQARLMDWLPVVASMDWSAVSRSHHADVEDAYDARNLLHFAAIRMVDCDADVLMGRCVIDFYSDLLHSQRRTSAPTTSSTSSSPSLCYLITTGLHAQTAAIYLQLPGNSIDPLASSLLYGPAANYIATYASSYPEHFLASEMPQQVKTRISTALDLSLAMWAHATSPKNDLHLIASLPPQCLLPGGRAAAWSDTPISLLPSRSTNSDVLKALATIFGGPRRRTDTVLSEYQIPDIDREDNTTEAAASRALYLHYVANNPTFWRDISSHVDAIAFKDLSLAAISCMTAVINANWHSTPAFPLPSTIPVPEAGYLAILSPPALDFTLPCLLAPPLTISSIAGARADPDNSLYVTAAAKFDALRALHSKLTSQVLRDPVIGYEEIRDTLAKRIAEGAIRRHIRMPGRIATLDG